MGKKCLLVCTIPVPSDTKYECAQTVRERRANAERETWSIRPGVKYAKKEEKPLSISEKLQDLCMRDKKNI